MGGERDSLLYRLLGIIQSALFLSLILFFLGLLLID